MQFNKAPTQHKKVSVHKFHQSRRIKASHGQVSSDNSVKCEGVKTGGLISRHKNQLFWPS